MKNRKYYFQFNTTIFLSMFFVQGCLLDMNIIARKSQPAHEDKSATITKYKLVTDTSWKLVSSTDPAVSSISDNDYLIFSFSKDYTGAIRRVLNGDRFDEPVQVFKYNVDTEQSLIRLSYSFDGNQDPVDYAFEIGEGLTLVAHQGYEYHFTAMSDTGAEGGDLYANTQCTGTMGDYDVYVSKDPTNSDLLSLYVVSYQIRQAGDIATVVIANGSMDSQTVMDQIVFENNASVHLGDFTRAELTKFNLIDITSYVAGVPYSEASPDFYTTCRFNIPN